MENIQINGQKIRGPPKNWTGPPPPHGTEIFIKNIPDDIFEDELFYLFSSVGSVYEVRLPVHWTGMNKGYAFVRYTKISEADAAIEKLNNAVLTQGRQIKVERSLDNTRLFLSCVPDDKTGEEIKSDLLTVVENIKTVYVYPALDNPAVFRGYAFVEFMCHRDAAIAKRILTPDVLLNLFEKKCIAAWANPLPFLNKETIKNINILFMRNIPRDTKSISIKIAVDSLIYPDCVNKIKRLNDYAFLTFKNHEVAEQAMNKIKCNPYLLGINPVHVEWAIPRESGGSFCAKDLDLEENNKENSRENDSSLSNVLLDFKTNHPKFRIEDYLNKSYLSFDNNANIKILQKPAGNNDGFTLNLKPDSQNFLEYINESKMESSVFSHDRDKCTGDLNSFTGFYSGSAVDNYREMHLRNWLQSLSLTDQFRTCNSSPSLTSPSIESSTNLSWKCDESHSAESGMSLEFDAKNVTKVNNNIFSEFFLS